MNSFLLYLYVNVPFTHIFFPKQDLENLLNEEGHWRKWLLTYLFMDLFVFMNFFVKAITFLLFVDDSSSCTLLNSAAYRWLEKGRKNLDFLKFEYFCWINIICLSNFIFVRANPKLSKQMLIFSGQYINRQNKSLLMVC